jgi:hypothetical protein
MADSPEIGKVLRDLTQAYLDGLARIGSAIGDLAKSRMPDAERQTEHWIGVARAAKDGYVAAIDKAFAAWERGVRRTLGRKSEKEQKPGSSVFEGWLDEWRKANESFMESIRSSGLGEEALKQTRDLRKAFDDGLKNLQKLWKPEGKDEK